MTFLEQQTKRIPNTVLELIGWRFFRVGAGMLHGKPVYFPRFRLFLPSSNKFYCVFRVCMSLRFPSFPPFDHKKELSNATLKPQVQNGGRITLGSNKREIPILARLDRFLISIEMDELFPCLIQEALPNPCSDHVPIKLSLNAPYKPRSQFRFDRSWLLSHELPDVVANAWHYDGSTVDATINLVIKLRNTRAALKNRSFKSRAAARHLTDELLGQLQYLDQKEERNLLTTSERDLRLSSRMNYKSFLLPKKFIGSSVPRPQSSQVCLSFLDSKKEAARTPADFRPISLIHSCIKIVSKVLASRLKSFLDALIDPAQTTTYIKGRSILNNFLCTNEILHPSKKADINKAVCKLDFIKAFDRVSSPYLTRLLSSRGFLPKWLQWVNNLLSSAKIAPCVNGELGNWIVCRRGLRQVFKLPQWAIRRIDRYRRSFLWTGTSSAKGLSCKVNWNTVCLDKEEGGLGIKDFSQFNESLRAKRGWRLIKKVPGLWRRQIEFAYHKRVKLSVSWKPLKRCSSLWKGVIHSLSAFWNRVDFRIGNGCQTLFWKDNWLGDVWLIFLIEHLVPGVSNCPLTHPMMLSINTIFSQICSPLLI
ncbi:uncharacterized protein [Elaeis guineensis]|uniref:uncharacterized protein n=1 Tax=Elaeis guineensis var. tenera TaxID=51953 RepID=UPI003C6D9C50